MTTEISKITGATGYKFNNLEEIKSHSSILFNERMAILFYLLDMKSISMNTNYDLMMMKEVKSILQQIYKNVRMVIRYNPTMRASLNLETIDNGIYVPDIVINLIENMIKYCDENGYTIKKLYIIINELNKFEVMIKDILQYYNYFIRPTFKQKPDIEIATENYKNMIDGKTLDELKEIVGDKHRINFDELTQITINKTEELLENYEKNKDKYYIEEDNEYEDKDSGEEEKEDEDK
jgi:hypothetical protein